MKSLFTWDSSDYILELIKYAWHELWEIFYSFFFNSLSLHGVDKSYFFLYSLSLLTVKLPWILGHEIGAIARCRLHRFDFRLVLLVYGLPSNALEPSLLLTHKEWRETEGCIVFPKFICTKFSVLYIAKS